MTHIIIERDLPFSADIVIRVYVSGPRNSGFLEFDAQGNVLEINAG